MQEVTLEQVKAARENFKAKSAAAREAQRKRDENQNQMFALAIAAGDTHKEAQRALDELINMSGKYVEAEPLNAALVRDNSGPGAGHKVQSTPARAIADSIRRMEPPPWSETAKLGADLTSSLEAIGRLSREIRQMKMLLSNEHDRAQGLYNSLIHEISTRHGIDKSELPLEWNVLYRRPNLRAT